MANYQRHSSNNLKQAARQRPKVEPLSQEVAVSRELHMPSLLQRAVTRPRLVTPSSVPRLQRAFGNRACSGMLANARPKLTVRPIVGQAIQRAPAQPTVGGQMPEIKDLNANRYFSQLPLKTRRQIRKQVLDDKKATALTDLTPAKRPTAGDATKIVTAFKKAVDATDGEWEAYDKTWKDASLSTIAKRYNLINTLYNHLRDDLTAKVRQLYARLDKELDLRTAAMAKKPKVGTIPNENTRKAFAAALKGMPGFKKLVLQIKSKGKAEKQVNLTGGLQNQWKDGGALTDKIVEVPPETGFAQLDTDLKNGKFKKKVQEADNFYRMLVEPNVLNKISRPTIKVHKEKSYDADPRPRNVGGGFVAHQSGNEVHVGQDVFRQIVIHEIGHYVEGKVPKEKWQDIQLLMRARHAKAGGGTLGAYGTMPRYKGQYPATGGYTSRAYGGGGSTEVMSMTLEYLSQKGKIENMLQKDPQQVAIVIRALRPTEYKSYTPLRKFDDLLP